MENRYVCAGGGDSIKKTLPKKKETGQPPLTAENKLLIKINKKMETNVLVKGANRAAEIVAGKILDSGNATFREITGMYYFVPQAILESAGIKVAADITYPLNCWMAVREIGTRNPNAVATDKKDAKGNAIFKDIVTDLECKEFLEEKTLREEITCIFKDHSAYLDHLAKKPLEKAELAAHIVARGKAAGLDEDLIAKIAEASAVQL